MPERLMRLPLPCVFNCPVYTYEFILSSAGIILEEEEDGEDAEKELVEEDVNLGEMTNNDLADYSTDELEAMLGEAIADEDYERASRIRDEINSRKNQPRPCQER